MRLFVAFDVPDPQKMSIEKAIQPLRLRLPKARWTSREAWHVTLKFLGEVTEDRLAEVREIIDASALASTPTPTRLTDVGSFPSPKRARVLWVGLEDAQSVMAGIARSMEEAFTTAGFRREGRELHPHLTIARFRVTQLIEDVLLETGPFQLDRLPFEVGEIVLYRSHLSPKGATYEALEHFHLGGRGI